MVGIVENPQSLLDEFALVLPGQVKSPNDVTVLFDAPGVNPSSIGEQCAACGPYGGRGSNVTTPASVALSTINPETLSLAVLTIGMLLIALDGDRWLHRARPAAAALARHAGIDRRHQ